MRGLVVVLGLWLVMVMVMVVEGRGRGALVDFQERRALIRLRSALGLRSKDWPIKGDPCLVWKGIQCENRHVVGLNISGFRRTRIGKRTPRFAVDALANLTLLVSFNATKFLLPGSIPEWFGLRMRSLRVLDLRFCSVMGSIPASLGNLTSLNSIYLSDNELTGIIPPSIGNLVNLSVFDIARNSVHGAIPSSLGSLVNLTVLDMSLNMLDRSIPVAIGTLLKLKVLNLAGNKLSSSVPAQLGNLTSLVDLDLSSNLLSGPVPPKLGGMKNLQRMVIGNNKLFGSLPGDMFLTMNQLQVVTLGHNNFSGALPDTIWSMPSLRFLDGSDNDFTGLLPNISVNASGRDVVFNLSQNLLYGTITSVVAGFRFVNLSGNYLEGKPPDYALRKASLDDNCLQKLSNQRTSKECSSFYSQRGLSFDNFGSTNVHSGKNLRTLIIAAGAVGGILLILIIVSLLAVLLICAHRKGGLSPRRNGVGPVPAEDSSQAPGASLDLSNLGESFTYEQLLQATNEFNDSFLLKHGHSGDLFKGILEGGIPIVIKRISWQLHKKEEYSAELDFLSKVSHIRFVPLLGHFLDHENEKFLVYKFIVNGDLSNSLFRKTESEDDSIQSLDWITRLKIATGAAEGLSYLHHECTPPLVHRDVQASSILLDDRFEVRLGSLSSVHVQDKDVHQSRIAKFLRAPQTSEQGTSGSPPATYAYDVYCFGKVLLELITGNLGISASDDKSVKDWLDRTLPLINVFDKELLTKILDPSLIVDDDLLEEVWAMAIVAKSCVNPRPSRRPLMKYVLKALEDPLRVVRPETNSGRLPTSSFRASWNPAALFGSWRHSSSKDHAAAVPSTSAQVPEPNASSKHSDNTKSHGSGKTSKDAEGHSSSNRSQSKEYIRTPSDVRRADRPHGD
uniref:Brassinosteroid LRR receptor kinase n=1 Tax=Sedum alfredii TaxID=439688 RepID=A0A410N675_9MAGN|nr:brassinosteroid LRR receptor kinase [Sedum alfredii]